MTITQKDHYIMQVSTLRNSWKESLELFHKTNIKLFCLGMLNNWTISLKILIRFFWWLFLGGLILFTIPSTEYPLVAKFITISLEIILLYVMIMTVRPSLEAKNYSYYSRYLMVLIPILLFMPLIYLSSLFIPLIALCLLFYVDSTLSPKGFCKALVQTGKAFLNFLPATSIIFIIASLFAALGSYIYDIMCTASLHWLLMALIKCFGLCIKTALILLCLSTITIYYIKIKHAHFKLLFE